MKVKKNAMTTNISKKIRQRLSGRNRYQGPSNLCIEAPYSCESLTLLLPRRDARASFEIALLKTLALPLKGNSNPLIPISDYILSNALLFPHSIRNCRFHSC
mmetsp:Transcript_8984/g.11918  ORF Transcript_8984/g.11918 Transcript_8984/m.11918 type:complete len:102 (-) Transcript_8984:49-354(-)